MLAAVESALIHLWRTIKMAKQEIQKKDEKKVIDGGWALLVFVVALLGILLMGFLLD